MQLTVPPTVTQNLARVKSLVARGEPVRAIDALLAAIHTFDSAQVLGRARSGVEIAIHECVDICNNQEQVHALLRELAGSDKAAIVYTPGEEGKLANVLRLIRKALDEAEVARDRAAEEALQARREEAFAAAGAAFRAGEAPKGRALLHRISEEFGTQRGVLEAAADLMIEAGFMPDALPYLEGAIEAFPRDSGPYSKLATGYMALREFEKAEKLYRTAIKEFGAHPKTLLNLGKVYIAWNKKDKAFEVLQQAVRQEPDNEEAKELFAKVDR